jgi:hypothetical protein
MLYMMVNSLVTTTSTSTTTTIPGTTLPAIFQTFQSGKGNGGVLSGDYSRENIGIERMQLFAEINNSETDPEKILIPNGLGWGDPGGQRDDSWSEGGINYPNLKRNIAHAFDRDMIAGVGLWITNIDPLEDRTYKNADVAPNLPVVNETGYRTFLYDLNNWILENYGDNPRAYVLWEPCWEFNLWPFTNWNGAGGNRYWAIHPTNYKNAMITIRQVLDSLGPDRRIILSSHIVAWSADEWHKRGKLRINGSDGSPETVDYLNGMRECDVWGISLYGSWDNDEGYLTDEQNLNDVKEKGIEGYIDWKFEKIIKQCAEDPDIGDTFIGTFEYNMPYEISELRTDLIPEYTEEELDQMATHYINYTYSKVPEYFDYIKYNGWWVPFGSDNQMNSWKYWSSYYDGYTP